jgi:hypothetical protein
MKTKASKNKRNIVFTPSFGYEKSCNRIIFRGEYTYNPGKKMLIAGGDDRLDGYNNASYSDHRLVFGIAYKI